MSLLQLQQRFKRIWAGDWGSIRPSRFEWEIHKRLAWKLLRIQKLMCNEENWKGDPVSVLSSFRNEMIGRQWYDKFRFGKQVEKIEEVKVNVVCVTLGGMYQYFRFELTNFLCFLIYLYFVHFRRKKSRSAVQEHSSISSHPVKSWTNSCHRKTRDHQIFGWRVKEGRVSCCQLKEKTFVVTENDTCRKVTEDEADDVPILECTHEEADTQMILLSVAALPTVSP